MPDSHVGVSSPIGLTMTYTDKIVPGLIGTDASCSMSYIKVPEIDLHTLDKIIHQHIPSGFEIHKPGKLSNKTVKQTIALLDRLNMPLRDELKSRIINSIGTLGSGNHFLEVDKSIETNQNYLVVHSGSRNLGLQIYKYYQDKAIQNLKSNKYNIDNMIKQMKEEGRESEIESVIKKMKDNNKDIPKDLSYLEGNDLNNYLEDIEIADKYADLNRRTIIEIIFGKLGLKTHKMNIMTTKHNYIDTKHKILRKGAVSAYEDEEIFIPFNMRDGSIIAIGKGNENWNCSAPHGAGRLMSRSKAKENISLDDFVESMKGIYSSSIKESTIDESPMAYKNAKEIESLISDTVEVREHLKPLYNYKAS